MSGTTRDGPGDGVGGEVVVGLTGATGHIGGLLLRRLLDDPNVSEVRSVARRPLPLPEGQSASRPRWPIRVLTCDNPSARRSPGCRLALPPRRSGVARRWRRGPRGDVRHQHRGHAQRLIARPGAVVLGAHRPCAAALARQPAASGRAPTKRGPNPECPYAFHKLLAERVCALEADRWAGYRPTGGCARPSRRRQGGAGCPWLPSRPFLGHRRIPGGAVARRVRGSRRLVGHGKGPDRRGDAVAGEVVNLATADWLTATDVAGLARSRQVKLPRSALLRVSELGKRLGITPFGADRAVLIGGPLALSVAKAERLLGWRPGKTSAQVLSAAMARRLAHLPAEQAVVTGTGHAGARAASRSAEVHGPTGLSI